MLCAILIRITELNLTRIGGHGHQTSVQQTTGNKYLLKFGDQGSGPADPEVFPSLVFMMVFLP